MCVRNVGDAVRPLDSLRDHGSELNRSTIKTLSKPLNSIQTGIERDAHTVQ